MPYIQAKGFGAIHDHKFSEKPDELLKKFGCSPQDVIKAVKEVIKMKR